VYEGINNIRMATMEDTLKSAVILSILSNPSKLGLWDNPFLPPSVILKKLPVEKFKVQEIIELKYSKITDKAADLIIERCIRKKIRIVTIWDDEYPRLLKEIHNPPIVLYLSGELAENRMISIVGTRNSDEKSEEITAKIAENASLLGCTVVSGMALGIDRNAHLGALKGPGGTIAVLPGGIDVIYPYKNSDIYRMISESAHSALISEYPPGIGTGQKWTFARRNRIISGMSEVVIVVQAPIKSGAMITARYAIEQNRDLFVCPGNAFDEKYSGSNELIRQGAAIFSDMNDLFNDEESGRESFKICIPDKKDLMKSEEIESKVNSNEVDSLPDDITGKVEIRILEELKNDLINIDEFIRRNAFSADEVNQGITVLEISGYIERKGSRLYKS